MFIYTHFMMINKNKHLGLSFFPYHIKKKQLNCKLENVHIFIHGIYDNDDS